MHDDRRKSYRYPSTAGDDTVVLRHGGVDYTAEMLNVSAEGFRLGISHSPDEQPTVQAGDMAAIATGNGGHKVRIANVHDENGTLQLGVERLQDIHEPAVRRRSERPSGEQRFNGRRCSSPFSSSWVTFAAVAVVFGTALIVAIFLSTNFGAPNETAAAGSTQRASKQASAAHASSSRSAASDEGTWGGQNETANNQPPVELRTNNAAEMPSREAVMPNESPTAGQSPGEASSSLRQSGNPSASSLSGSSARDSSSHRLAAEAVAASSLTTLFDSKLDATANIATAVKQATRESKRVLLEFGTNASASCYRLHDLFTKNSELSSWFSKHFILVVVDMEANRELASRFLPDDSRQQVPFLAILDQDGTTAKSQSNNAIEANAKPDLAKLKAFLQETPATK
jgi:Thioredoxin-like